MSKITIQIIPNAKQNAVVGYENGAWKIRIQAPPFDGRANEELIQFLAEILDVAPSTLRITSGQWSRKKHIETDLQVVEIEERLKSCVHD